MHCSLKIYIAQIKHYKSLGQRFHECSVYFRFHSFYTFSDNYNYSTWFYFWNCFLTKIQNCSLFLFTLFRGLRCQKWLFSAQIHTLTIPRLRKTINQQRRKLLYLSCASYLSVYGWNTFSMLKRIPINFGSTKGILKTNQIQVFCKINIFQALRPVNERDLGLKQSKPLEND